MTDPCNKFVTLNDTWRTPLTSAEDNPHCDVSLKQGWYRFMLDTYSADMLFVPLHGGCGTYAQIWWNGKQTKVDMSRKPVYRAVFFTNCNLMSLFRSLSCYKYFYYNHI